MNAATLTVCMLHALLASANPPFRIHHRIWDPATPLQPFTLRANLQVSPDLDPVLLVPQNHAELVLDPDHPENVLYQIALERESDLSEGDWDLSSVKACHLPLAHGDIMNLHISPRDNKPYAIDFFLHPIPHDGSCPKKPSTQTVVTFTNTTVNFKHAGSPPLPELRVPPPLSPKGEPIQPEPEKSFIQKYWAYLAIGLLTLMLVGGAPEEEQARPGSARPGR